MAGSAKTVKPNRIVTDGPYTEIKVFISGYIVVKTDTMDEAVELAKANPIFEIAVSFNNPDFIHGLFGKMSKDQIGIFVCKHYDHHLRQFGV